MFSDDELLLVFIGIGVKPSSIPLSQVVIFPRNLFVTLCDSIRPAESFDFSAVLKSYMWGR